MRAAFVAVDAGHLSVEDFFLREERLPIFASFSCSYLQCSSYEPFWAHRRLLLVSELLLYRIRTEFRSIFTSPGGVPKQQLCLPARAFLGGEVSCSFQPSRLHEYVSEC